MKQATSELIALLANSSQFVMWEEFEFTLSDGSTVVYTTADPDAPAIAANIGTGFLSDSFDGSGTLDGRVASVGGSWALVQEIQSPLTEFILSGDGYVSANLGASSYLTTSGVPGASDAYRLEGVIEFVGSPTDGETARCSLFAFDDGVNFFGWECELSVADGGTSVNLFIGASPDGIESQTFSTDTGLPATGSYTLRVDVNALRNTVTAFINGSNIGSIETILQMPAVGVCGMSMNGIATANPRLHNIEGV